jgi:hypothetical protein
VKATKKRLGLLTAATLSAVAMTMTSATTAVAAPPPEHVEAATTSALVALPYRAMYQSGMTTGTYTITPPGHGILTTLQMTGQLASTRGCYTAEVGVRLAGTWAYRTVATNCSPLPVTYRVATTALVVRSPAFGVRVCAADGGCGPVTVLSAFGIRN